MIVKVRLDGEALERLHMMEMQTGISKEVMAREYLIKGMVADGIIRKKTKAELREELRQSQLKKILGKRYLPKD